MVTPRFGAQDKELTPGARASTLLRFMDQLGEHVPTEFWGLDHFCRHGKLDAFVGHLTGVEVAAGEAGLGRGCRRNDLVRRNRPVDVPLNVILSSGRSGRGRLLRRPSARVSGSHY